MTRLDAFVRRSMSVSGEIVAHIETLISNGSLVPGAKLPAERPGRGTTMSGPGPSAPTRTRRRPAGGARTTATS
jgi:hypothetical protein